jgi:putative polysaccharide biosynthesis protein
VRPPISTLLAALAWRMRWLRKLVRDLRTAAAETGSSTPRILWDLVRLNATHLVGVRAYFQYRLFDPKLTYQQKLEYLPDSRIATQRLWSLLTPPEYRLPFANKLVFNRVFGGAGLPVARILGVFDPRVGWSSDGASLRTAAELRRWLRDRGQEGFVFKPMWGSEGRQVLVFTGSAPDDADCFQTLAGDRYDAEHLVSFAENTAALHNVALGDPRAYLIEERIRPHPALAELVGPTLCCVRVVTIIGVSGRPHIVGAVYKMQPKPLGVDHLSYGALGCWVNLDTGALSPGRSRHDFDYASVIPGTARPFVGFQLPHWDSIKELALRAAMVFPLGRGIGWDVAISDRGPLLIEGNAHWSTSLLQIPAPGGLLTGEFKALIDALASTRKTWT